MSQELSLYFYSVVLTFLQIGVPAMLALSASGIPWGVSNREDPPQSSAMHGRALRARDNMLENMVVFTGLIVVASSMGVSNEGTMMGAQLFFWGRVVHALSYLFGIIYVRTLAWFAGVVGMVMIALEIYGAASM